jgi:hypothetical protein
MSEIEMHVRLIPADGRIIMNTDRDNSHSAADRFPATRYSAILALSSSDVQERDRALDLLVRAYWNPAYKYLRVRWHLSADDAAVLVQSFFASAIEKEFLADYDQSKARFRTYVRLCLDRFAGNENRRQTAQKRGGDSSVVSIDFAVAEQDLEAAGLSVPPDIDSWFDREWTRQLFALAVERLRIETETDGKAIQFKLFRQYDLLDRDPEDNLTYESLACEHMIAVTDVTNHLTAMRRRFRAIVLELIRELTSSDEEYRDEVRTVLGIKI